MLGLKQTDLNHKYKDRNPMETVGIVNAFFASKGYVIDLIHNIKTEADTYWCHLDLKNKDNESVLTSNGKGATLEYSLASGHAELYERYCAGFSNDHKDLIQSYKNNFQNLNYYISPDEKLLTLEETIASNETMQDFFKVFNDPSNYLFKSYLKNFDADKVLPCVSFMNLNSKNYLYFNLEMLNNIQGSDGLAAGNTIEEAIVQGMSEIYEHYVTDKLYYNNNKDVIYYQLNLQKMKNDFPQYLIEIIDKIEAKGYHLTVYDLSYNFNMPVILTIIVDNNHLVYVNIGAAPVFYIALERTLTEIYQGRMYFNFEDCGKFYMKPYREFSVEQSIYSNISTLTMRDNYPEELLLNKQIVDTYNHNVFLSNQNYTNQELVKYCIELNKINSFEIYIRDLSQVQEIRAIRLFCTNKVIFPWKHNIFITIPKEVRNKIQFIASELLEEEFCSDKYFELLLKLEDIIVEESAIRDSMIIKEYLDFIFNKIIIFPVSSLNKFFSYETQIIPKEYKMNFNYFYSLYSYKTSNKYTDEEIVRIFTDGFKYLTYDVKKDLANIENIGYVIRKIFQR